MLTKTISEAILNNSASINSFSKGVLKRTFYYKSKGFTNVFGVFVIVHQKYACLLHRFNKYQRVLQPGLNFKIPFIETVAFQHDLRQKVQKIPHQHAVTQDNVSLNIDGVLFTQIQDPYKASYGVQDLEGAITNLAQTTMRSQIGKISLDKTFEERQNLNKNIIHQIEKEAQKEWGTKAIRYEIRDIEPPVKILDAMTKQSVAERQKRASILKSEGDRQAKINNAEGAKMEKKLTAEGLAEATILKAKAHANALAQISASLDKDKGRESASFILAERYFQAKKGLARRENTFMIEGDITNALENVEGALDILAKGEK